MIDNIDINKILVSNKFSFGKRNFKYSIGYKDAIKIRPLCILLPNMTAYRKDFVKAKCMSFLIKNENLLEKYNLIWKKVSNIIKKEFDSKPVYNKKYLKTKRNLIMQDTTHFFMIMKYQKKVLIYLSISNIAWFGLWKR